MPADLDKLAEMIIYVANRCRTHRSFGATKLNKILFAADFWAYTELGHTISAAEYQRLEHGPAPRSLPRVQKRLVEQRAVSEQVLGNSKRLVPARSADMDSFTRAEIRLLDEAIGWMRHLTAEEVSEWSHRFPGWKYVENGETIPPCTFFLLLEDDRSPPKPVNADTATWARSLMNA